jgi:ferredoxin-thioredoxin reductase catalytic subunit
VESEKKEVKAPERMQSEKKTRDVALFCDTVALPFPLKGILRQKKNYGTPNISPCKTKIFKTSSKRNQNPSR